MSTYGGTLDAVTVDPTTGLPAPGVAVYAFADDTSPTVLGSVLSDLGGGFVLDLPDVDLDVVWVSTSTTGDRFPVTAREALSRKATTVDVDAKLATKANASTVAAQTTRIDNLDADKLSKTDASSTFAAADPVTAVTYNTDGTVKDVTENGVKTSYTYNADGTIATQTRAGVTRTYSYSGGNLTGVA